MKSTIHISTLMAILEAAEETFRKGDGDVDVAGMMEVIDLKEAVRQHIESHPVLNNVQITTSF